jgi:hypothetical protein
MPATCACSCSSCNSLLSMSFLALIACNDTCVFLLAASRACLRSSSAAFNVWACKSSRACRPNVYCLFNEHPTPMTSIAIPMCQMGWNRVVAILHRGTAPLRPRASLAGPPAAPWRPSEHVHAPPRGQARISLNKQYRLSHPRAVRNVISTY